MTVTEKMTQRSKWLMVALLVMLHPFLIHIMVPIFGEAANMFVFVAPVAASVLFGWPLGMAVVVVNVTVTALMFGRYLGISTDEALPKTLLSSIVLAALCVATDKIRHFLNQRKALAAELEQAKKMEAIGRLAGGVAHDMNNTLNAIMGSVFAHRQELEAFGGSFKDLDNITAACDRGAQLTQNLLGFARKSEINHQIFSLNRVVEATELLLRRTVRKSITIETELADDEPFLEGDRGQIENAIMNLCLNSLDAMSQCGTITMATSNAGSFVSVCVKDTGMGMDDSLQEQVFEPFFTTKVEGKGTGLGLSLVYGTVHAMNGKISLESSPGDGTMVSLSFPKITADLYQADRSTLPPGPSEGFDALQGQNVLIIDDEPLVLRASTRMLGAMGCNVRSGLGGEEGLRLFQMHQSEISLVMLDLIMPHMDGMETLRQIQTINPDVLVIIVSGYSDNTDSPKLAEYRKPDSKVQFLPKPYRAEDLSKIARRLLQRNESPQYKAHTA